MFSKQQLMDNYDHFGCALGTTFGMPCYDTENGFILLMLVPAARCFCHGDIDMVKK